MIILTCTTNLNTKTKKKKEGVFHRHLKGKRKTDERVDPSELWVVTIHGKLRLNHLGFISLVFVLSFYSSKKPFLVDSDILFSTYPAETAKKQKWFCFSVEVLFLWNPTMSETLNLTNCL